MFFSFHVNLSCIIQSFIDLVPSDLVTSYEVVMTQCQYVSLWLTKEKRQKKGKKGHKKVHIQLNLRHYFALVTDVYQLAMIAEKFSALGFCLTSFPGTQVTGCNNCI